MKNFRPLILFTVFVLTIGLACSAVSSGDNPSPTQPPQQEEPVQASPTDAPTVEPTQPPAEPAPTVTQAPTPVPTEDIAASMYFTEEFDSDLSNDWYLFTVTGSDQSDRDKLTVNVENGKLVWNFDSEYLYAYLFYDAFVYEDVRLETRADNLGKNNNNISLICRFDPDVGWYEFNIANNGLYDIFYAEVTSSGDINYNLIVNGGSNAIKQGRDVNEYAIECKGDKLTLYINGDEANSISERKYGLRSGEIGISVSSFNVLPILIEMDWIKVSEP